jgi:hypothetical protein
MLLQGAQWSGAYYLSGYAVECALKARLTKSLRMYQMPDKKLIEKYHTHDLDALAKEAELNGTIEKASQDDPTFNIYWTTVKDWNESSRYAIWSEARAKDMVRAVTDRDHGVLQWLKQHW